MGLVGIGLLWDDGHQSDEPQVIEAFRAGGPIEGMNRDGLVLLTTVGRKTGQRHTTPMMFDGGALDRFPNLKVVVAEAGVGWIPFFAQEFDYYQTSVFGEPWALPHPPSEYVYRQVYGAFISDEVGGYLLSKYGEDTFMWSNDYPHGACIWPLSTGVIAKDLGHLTPEARHKITAGTAAKLLPARELR